MAEQRYMGCGHYVAIEGNKEIWTDIGAYGGIVERPLPDDPAKRQERLAMLGFTDDKSSKREAR